MKHSVAIMPEYPFPLAYGGIEVRASRFLQLLQASDCNVCWLDHYDRDQTFDLLHVFGNPPSILEAVEFASVKGRVVIDAVLGGSGYSFGKRIIKLRSLSMGLLGARDEISRVARAFSIAKIVIAITHGEAELLNRLYDVPKSKIRVIPNCVDDKVWGATRDLFQERVGRQPFVLYVGAITPRKNPLMLLQALNRLGLQGVFIGPADPGCTTYVEAFREALNVQGSHRWLGQLNHDDPLLASAYAAATLFCLPSQNEGQPQALLEAMAAGNRAVIADRPWANFPPFDHLRRAKLNIESLSEVIGSAMDDDSKPTRLGDEFRSSRYSGIVKAIYEEAML